MSLTDLTLRADLDRLLTSQELDQNQVNLRDAIDKVAGRWYGETEPPVKVPGMEWIQQSIGVTLVRDPTNTTWLRKERAFVDMTGYSPVSSFKNKIINGDFLIWQRGASQITSGYGSDDRWLNYHVGSTKTHSQQVHTPGQAEVPGNPIYFSRTTVTSIAGDSNGVAKIQRIEDVRTFSGMVATLSFNARADSPKKIGVVFYQNFGVGGSPAVVFGSHLVDVPTIWKRFAITISVPSIMNMTIGVNNFISPVFVFDAGTSFLSGAGSVGRQSGTFDLSEIQFEAGAHATEFEQRPFTIEEALCQRYFEAGVSGYESPNLIGQASSSKFRVIKRVIPTFVSTNFYNIVNAKIGANRFITTGEFGRYCSAITDSAGQIAATENWTADAEL